MIKPYWRKHQERIKAWLSETTTFLIKWNRNRWYSDLTHTFWNKWDLASYMFAHWLPKWLYPEYRNNPNNIIFVDNIAQHNRVDSKIAWNHQLVISLIQKGKLAEYLRMEYCKEHNIRVPKDLYEF